MYGYRYSTELGTIFLAEDGVGITHLDLLEGIDFPDGFEEKETDLLAEAFRQLTEYLHGKRKEFDLPLAPAGTEFQKRVWNQLVKIPYGQTRTYKQVAEAANCPKGYRAVGLANNRNPVMIFIPCHRVIGSDGSLVGFGGGLPVKKWLLNHEKEWK